MGMNEAIEPGASGPAGEACRWSFGPVVLDERTLELLVNGAAVAIERKPLEVLLFLLNHAGEVVTKDEILKAVWPGRVATESVLTKCIAKLREAFKDDNQQLIRTQHGYGYRLVAEVKVEASTAPPPARLGFKPGDKPPSRALWSLVERLGTGGHGEVWLARHDKTREQRVFKFALDPAALTSLKREITLYRVLHDSLGDAAAIVPILDWNLEEPPYFLEAEHSGDNLIQWAEQQGGLAGIPQATRLDIAAQIADALAQAHSVGVLHKDLKPSNVLISPTPEGGVKVRLSDFGSGGVLDPHRLEVLGITRLGFTRTIAASGSTSGTPTYFAPEVTAGQPFTTQADIYALGVILYQLIVGDFRRALAPGWEQDIEDQLLREDIGATCAGNPAKRLPDASLLATRLRTLEQRRKQQAEEKAQRERAERAQRLRQELKRLRVVAAVMLLLTIAAVTAGGIAYYAQKRAVAAAATTQAISDFLTKDLLGSADPWNAPVRDLTLKAVLKRAADKVDEKLASQPEAARQVHLTIGSALLSVRDSGPALYHAERYAELTGQLFGAASFERVRALNWIKRQLVYLGRMDDACGLAEEIGALIQQQRAPAYRHLIIQRFDDLMCRHIRGGVANFDAEASALLRDLESHPSDIANVALTMFPLLARHYWWGAGELEKAGALHRRALDLSVKESSEHHFETIGFRYELAGNLSTLDRFEEAERELQRADADVRAWIGESGEFELAGERVKLLFWSIHRLYQGRFEEAEALAVRYHAIVHATELGGSDVERVSWWLLAEAYQMQNRCDLALPVTSKALAQNKLTPRTWYDHALSLKIYEVAADCLRQQGKIADAWAVLNRLPPEVLAKFPERSPFLSFYYRARGLLYLHEGKTEEARADLTRALKLAEQAHPSWRLKRAREDLARVPNR